MVPFKTINDTVHGSIRVTDVALELLETPEVQRLNAIRQLGLTYLIFPGANHTRLEHLLGAYHVAEAMGNALGLPGDEGALVSLAALLHDIGHGPFSHTLERVITEQSGRDHMEVTKDLILGKAESVPPAERGGLEDRARVPDVLETGGVDPPEVAELIRGCQSIAALPGLAEDLPRRRRAYLGQIVHSALDADQIDFLLRDALYTGVAHGIIDLPRLLDTFRLWKGELVVDRKGLSAVEGTLVARGLMYTSVYFHKTVRIAETMLARAVERMDHPPEALRFMNDAELMAWLVDAGDAPQEIALRLKYRRLYKRVLTRERSDLSTADRERLAELADPKRRRRLEDTVCQRAGIPLGQTIVDVPAPELLLTEPRIGKVDLKVLENGTARPFGQVSGLARALHLRQTVDWAVMVACPSPVADPVARAARKLLFG